MVSKRKQRSTNRGLQSPMAHFVCAGLVLSILLAGSKYYDSLGVDPILQAPDGAAHSAEELTAMRSRWQPPDTISITAT